MLPPVTHKLREHLSLISSYKPTAVTRGFLLRILNGEQHNRTYDLTKQRDGRPVTLYTLGRQEDNDICIESGYKDFVSRHHCTLEANRQAVQWRVLDGWWDGNQWRYSRNGTYVNSVPVKRKLGYWLIPGDIITLGGVTMRFENY